MFAYLNRSFASPQPSNRALQIASTSAMTSSMCTSEASANATPATCSTGWMCIECVVCTPCTHAASIPATSYAPPSDGSSVRTARQREALNMAAMAPKDTALGRVGGLCSCCVSRNEQSVDVCARDQPKCGWYVRSALRIDTEARWRAGSEGVLGSCRLSNTVCSSGWKRSTQTALALALLSEECGGA